MAELPQLQPHPDDNGAINDGLRVVAPESKTELDSIDEPVVPTEPATDGRRIRETREEKRVRIAAEKEAKKVEKAETDRARRLEKIDAFAVRLYEAADQQKLDTLNQYSEPDTGKKVLKTVIRLVTKVAVGAVVTAATGGAALPAVIGAFIGSEGARGALGLVRKKFSKEDQIREQLFAIQQEKLVGLAKAAEFVKKALDSEDGTYAEGEVTITLDQARFNFINILAEAQKMSPEEEKLAKQLKGKQRAWGFAGFIASVLGGGLGAMAGEGIGSEFVTDRVTERLGEQGINMKLGGLGEITKYSDELREMQELGHNVHLHDGQVVFDYQGGVDGEELELVKEVVGQHADKFEFGSNTAEQALIDQGMHSMDMSVEQFQQIVAERASEAAQEEALDHVLAATLAMAAGEIVAGVLPMNRADSTKGISGKELSKTKEEVTEDIANSAEAPEEESKEKVPAYPIGSKFQLNEDMQNSAGEIKAHAGDEYVLVGYDPENDIYVLENTTDLSATNAKATKDILDENFTLISRPELEEVVDDEGELHAPAGVFDDRRLAEDGGAEVDQIHHTTEHDAEAEALMRPVPENEIDEAATDKERLEKQIGHYAKLSIAEGSYFISGVPVKVNAPSNYPVVDGDHDIFIANIREDESGIVAEIQMPIQHIYEGAEIVHRGWLKSGEEDSSRELVGFSMSEDSGVKECTTAEEVAALEVEPSNSRVIIQSMNNNMFRLVGIDATDPASRKYVLKSDNGIRTGTEEELRQFMAAWYVEKSVGDTGEPEEVIREASLDFGSEKDKIQAKMLELRAQLESTEIGPEVVMDIMRNIYEKAGNRTEEEVVELIGSFSQLLESEKREGAGKLRPTIPELRDSESFVDGNVAFISGDCEAIFIGDTHGDPDAVRAIIQQTDFIGKISRGGKIKLVFLGDYADRGQADLENIEQIIQLKLAFPDNIVMIQGNHEEPGVAARYGFLKSLQSKYGDTAGNELFNSYMTVLSNLPNAVVTENGLIAVHGGIDQNVTNLTDLQSNEHSLHWADPPSDYEFDGMRGIAVNEDRGGTPIFGRDVLEGFLSNIGGSALIRAHEYGRINRVGWDGKIATVFSNGKGGERSAYSARAYFLRQDLRLPSTGLVEGDLVDIDYTKVQIPDAESATTVIDRGQIEREVKVLEENLALIEGAETLYLKVREFIGKTIGLYKTNDGVFIDNNDPTSTSLGSLIDESGSMGINIGSSTDLSTLPVSLDGEDKVITKIAIDEVSVRKDVDGSIYITLINRFLPNDTSGKDDDSGTALPMEREEDVDVVPKLDADSAAPDTTVAPPVAPEVPELSESTLEAINRVLQGKEVTVYPDNTISVGDIPELPQGVTLSRMPDPDYNIPNVPFQAIVEGEIDQAVAADTYRVPVKLKQAEIPEYTFGGQVKLETIPTKTRLMTDAISAGKGVIARDRDLVQWSYLKMDGDKYIFKNNEGTEQIYTFDQLKGEMVDWYQKEGGVATPDEGAVDLTNNSDTNPADPERGNTGPEIIPLENGAFTLKYDDGRKLDLVPKKKYFCKRSSGDPIEATFISLEQKPNGTYTIKLKVAGTIKPIENLLVENILGAFDLPNNKFDTEQS